MTATSQLKIFDAQFAAGINFKALTGVLGMKSSTICEYYVGEHINMTLQDLSGNGRHLSPAGSPVCSDSFLLDNNKMPVQKSILDGSSMYFSRAHAAWMDFAQIDFSMSFLLYSNSAGKYLLGHGTTNTNGYTVYTDANGYPCCALHKAGSARVATWANALVANAVNLVQVNRSRTSLIVSLNGVDGTSPGDPATYGIAVSDVLYYGCYRGPANYWAGSIIYWRANAEPTTADQRANEYNYVKGILATGGGKKYFVPTFTRAQAVMIDRVTGSKKIETVQSDWPVKGPDGSLFMHSEIPQVLTYTNVFDNVIWVKSDTVASLSATPLAPDGTATCYKLVAGVTDVKHGVAQSKTLTAYDHSFDVEAYPGDRDWIRLNNISIANCYAFFNIRLGLVGTVGAGCTASVNENRNSRFGIHFMGTAGVHSLEISPANANNDVDFAGDGATASVYIWQASCHLNKYQLPPIDRPSVVAVTRARDILSFTPASVFTNLWVGNSYRTKKLSFKWRAKNRFSSSIDMPALRMNHFCLGGNSGTAGNTRNMIWVYYSAGDLWCEIYDDISGVQKYMKFNAVVDAHKYHTYVITIDFTNLSLSSFKKDGVESGTRVMPASAYNLQFTDCSFNIGMGQYSIYPACMLDLDYLTMWEHLS